MPPRLRLLGLGLALAGTASAGSIGASFTVSISLATGIPAPPAQPGGDGGSDPVVIIPVTPPRQVVAPPQAPGSGGNVPGPPANVPDGQVVVPTPPALPSPPVAAASFNTAPDRAVCTGQTLGDGTNAVVRVLCSSGQFVRIQTASVARSTNPQSEPERVEFGPGTGRTTFALAASATTRVAQGTVTSLRFVQQNQQGPLEMLVSF